ncbi:MAG: hypothetical protein ICV64_03325 [Thermoleophilia bacterium]|nr:hypothetical protein [Thermoleophilia bacterium]
MVVSMHVATGALAGVLTRSRRAAIVLGPVLHAAADRTPHEDIASRRFEVGCGIALVGALVLARGPFHPAVLGALAASAPDVEHLVRLPRPGGGKLFPTHRFLGWHPPGGVPAWAQVLAAGTLVGALLRAGGEGREGSTLSARAALDAGA